MKHRPRFLLNAVGAGQSVVVGHSYGGIVAVAIAKRFPQMAKTLVLVDPAPPTNDAFKNALDPAIYSKYVDKRPMMKLFTMLGSIGVLRVFSITPYKLDPEQEKSFIEHASTRRTAEAILSEYDHMGSGADQLGKVNLPDVPLYVMCRTPERTIKLAVDYVASKEVASSIDWPAFSRSTSAACACVSCSTSLSINSTICLISRSTKSSSIRIEAKY